MRFSKKVARRGVLERGPEPLESDDVELGKRRIGARQAMKRNVISGLRESTALWRDGGDGGI